MTHARDLVHREGWESEQLTFRATVPGWALLPVKFHTVEGPAHTGKGLISRTAEEPKQNNNEEEEEDTSLLNPSQLNLFF